MPEPNSNSKSNWNWNRNSDSNSKLLATPIPTPTPTTTPPYPSVPRCLFLSTKALLCLAVLVCVASRAIYLALQAKMGSSPVDIITLENFEDKMPGWDPASPSHLYALVDMGSNGIRFTISDLSPPRARLLKCIYRERAAISLFDALNAAESGTGALVFPAETIELVSQTLARFRAIAVDDYGVPPAQVTVFATEAMRRAQNAVAMLEAIQLEAPDLTVHILAPQVETLFGSVGARSGFVDVKGLFLDLGGGSVQMTYMDTFAAKGPIQGDGHVGYEAAAALAGESLPFGAARLIKVLETADVEVQAAEKSKLHNGMGEAFETLRTRFPSLAATVAAAQEAAGSLTNHNGSAGIDIYLCGGGFRGYGSMLMHNDSIQPYPIPAIGTYTVSGELFGRTKDMLKINKNYDGKIFGMSKRRRAQFPAIVAVVEALVAAVPRIRSVTFCAGGNREGALMMKLPREIRESNPLASIHASEAPSTASARGKEADVQDAVLKTLLSAFPANLGFAGTTTIFGLDLGPLYASHIWDRSGEDSEANAAAALHDAVTRNPGSPGLTHLARAVLGLTLCARWGANLASIDQRLHQNLRALVHAADPDATFWADYMGAVTAALTRLVTTWPRSQGVVEDHIRFQVTTQSGKKLKIFLDILVSEKAARGIDSQDLVGLFKGLGKQKDKKVIVAVGRLG
ncbi:Ppx/GppA phosphatase family-domain-containing protein [Podospora appendiculata]|uniref:Ppx/GppA phosphatase family-domain-containing protein n=1 Tax=Podospora appendiculata TaxID=314037 RepID=A0AAE1CHR3_9PEZI|nr:Ppx/GppA phosphatase family-domain-containing protein [Podospora appendiculata]